MRLSIRLLLILVLSVWLVAGCASKPVRGVVVSKAFVPKHVDRQLTMMPDGNGGFIYLWIPTTVPDTYNLRIATDSDRTVTVSVGKDVYERMKPGDIFVGE